jgi:hypothetical protein
MSKVLFLDVDGVLNNIQTLLQAAAVGEFNPICDLSLSILKNIVQKTNCQIVLSSSWRLSEKNLNKLKLSFDKIGLVICGQTPDLIGARHLEIESWIESHIHHPALVAVLDDDGDAKIKTISKNIQEIFFQTSRLIGLDQTIADKMIEFFNK